MHSRRLHQETVEKRQLIEIDESRGLQVVLYLLLQNRNKVWSQTEINESIDKSLANISPEVEGWWDELSLTIAG